MKKFNLGLTKFELGLWVLSVFAVLASSLFSETVDILTIIASLIGVTALIFVAKGYALGQILTIVFAVFYGIISFFFKYYGEMITYLCMTAPIALGATISWLRHPYKGTKEVEVNRLTKKQVAVMIVSALIVTVAFYFILSAMGNANIIFSTISVTTSFVASYLTFYRSPYYAIGYAANDLVLIVLWVLAAIENISYFPMIVCFIMFFVNDIYGFLNWRRMEKRQNKE
ncbi:MAG: nicotinamide mononucleotide transporter [Oscillospiraceae bacterium]|nr:nicotinamide mononucleotide transporter [Oscillospiraceae bacterium]